jgi:hypothetical protein
MNIRLNSKYVFLTLTGLISFSFIAARYVYETKRIREFKLVYSQDYLPFIQGNLNEFKGHFLLDTGSDLTVSLDSSSLNQLSGLKHDGSRKIRYFDGSIISTEDFLMEKPILFGIKASALTITKMHESRDSLTHLTLNSKAVDNSGFQNEESHILHMLSTEASLGSGFLSHFNLLLDFKNHQFSIIKKGVFPVFTLAKFLLTDTVKIGFKLVENIGIICEAQTPLGPKRFLIDTGANCSYFIQENGRYQGVEDDGFYPQIYLEFIKIGSKNMGSFAFDILDCHNFSSHDGVLGTDFFYGKTLYIDYANKYLLLN